MISFSYKKYTKQYNEMLSKKGFEKGQALVALLVPLVPTDTPFFRQDSQDKQNLDAVFYLSGMVPLLTIEDMTLQDFQEGPVFVLVDPALNL